MRRIAKLVVVAMALWAPEAVAQTVVGSVVEEGTARPLGGAFVVLEDSTGSRSAGVLAGDEGRFVVRASRPGRYRLVVRFIGYADASTEYFSLDRGETVERAVTVAVRAVTLEGIRASVGSRCEGRPRGSETARLWEEARKALEITDWTATTGVLRYRIREWRRELELPTLRVTKSTERGRRGFYNQGPYRSRPAGELASAGYVQSAPEGGWDHFAPDAEVLLSDPFLDTHCFRVVEGDAPALVGLSFEPVPGRRLPDIEGVLWLDRGTAELERLDFRYVNLPYRHGDWPQVGGRVEFDRLASGTWIVRRWRIRMPLEASRTGGYGDSPGRLALRSVTEVGAEVEQARAADGRVLARATGAVLHGVVEDGLTGTPLVGATVRVLATNAEATTGPDGAFRLGALPSGTFTVQVDHPDLRLLGGEPVTRVVSLEAGSATRLVLTPSPSQRVLTLCKGAGTYRDPVLVHGTVRSPGSEAPAPGALVRVSGADRPVMADSVGAYAVCVERTDTVRVAASASAAAPRGAGEVVAVGSGRIVRAHPVLESVPVPAASTGRTWTNAILGRVYQVDTEAPIDGAMVSLQGEGGTVVAGGVTNADGRFRIMHPGGGRRTFTLTVRHVAYGAVTREVVFEGGEELRLDVALAERPIELDPIVVRERRRGVLARVGFYERMERNFGDFIERAEIERRAPGRVTDLLQGHSGWKVITVNQFQQDLRIQPPGTPLRGDCQPALWVDGIRVRPGGPPRVEILPNGQKVYHEPQLSDLVSVANIEAIEVYRDPAGLPLRYGGSDAMCGVVLIWTRAPTP